MKTSTLVLVGALGALGYFVWRKSREVTERTARPSAIATDIETTSHIVG